MELSAGGEKQTHLRFNPKETKIIRAAYREKIHRMAMDNNADAIASFDAHVANLTDESRLHADVRNIAYVTSDLNAFNARTNEILTEMALKNPTSGFANVDIGLRHKYGQRAGQLVVEIAEKAADHLSADLTDL